MANIDQIHLPFTVVYVSSQTKQNPASNIVNSSPFSDGWISIPNSTFPQELVLDFGNTVSLTQLKFTSHQSKIASDIQIFWGKDASNYQRSEFTFLTSFKFCNGKEHNFSKRESRTLHLPSFNLRFLRLLIKSVYETRENKTNQVGIVSIIADGLENLVSANDPELSQLEQMKKEAIDNEDYEKAKEIKVQIDSLRDNREILDRLKKQKDAAIANEDFDTAKQIKEQIDQIRFGLSNAVPPQDSYAFKLKPQNSNHAINNYQSLNYLNNNNLNANFQNNSGNNYYPEPQPAPKYIDNQAFLQYLIIKMNQNLIKKFQILILISI